VGTKRSKDTISALLGNAPALAPVPDDSAQQPPTSRSNRPSSPSNDVPSPSTTDSAPITLELQPGEQVYEATAEPVRPSHLRPADEPPAGEEVEEDDLEAFEFEADAPIVKPRRRKQLDYQTVRINRPTARILRAQWLMARQADPLISYTEFATIVCQHGLRALKEQRQRGE